VKYVWERGCECATPSVIETVEWGFGKKES